MQEKTVDINTREITVKGQTEGEWISLGQHRFLAGNKGSVTITGKNADGKISADAVLFIPDNK